MSFLIYILAGAAAGVLGGMGMGGGTVLIPVLTIFFGVNQHLAQAANVLSFLPMAALVLPAHARNGLLRTDDAWWIIVPALFTTVLAGFLMAALPTEVLGKLFGFFLIALAVKQLIPLLQKITDKPSGAGK